MLRKLSTLFTFSGIMLLIGTVVTDDWASMGERFYFAGIAIGIIAICQPVACFRLFARVLSYIASTLSGLLQWIRTTFLLNRHETEIGDHWIEEHNTNTASQFKHNYEYSDPVEYSPPATITRGNIEVLTDNEMHIFLRHYHKADEIKTKVKGVTYRNSDGTDRQNILAHCHAGDQLRFKAYKFKGDPAYAVYCDRGQIGNLSAELAEEIAAREKPFIILGEILNVSGGYRGEYFGCNIRVDIYEKN